MPDQSLCGLHLCNQLSNGFILLIYIIKFGSGHDTAQTGLRPTYIYVLLRHVQARIPGDSTQLAVTWSLYKQSCSMACVYFSTLFGSTGTSISQAVCSLHILSLIMWVTCRSRRVHGLPKRMRMDSSGEAKPHNSLTSWSIRLGAQLLLLHRFCQLCTAAAIESSVLCTYPKHQSQCSRLHAQSIY